MSFEPSPPPIAGPKDDKALREYVAREFRRISNLLKTVVYQQNPAAGSLSAGVSANWKLAGGIFRLSTSSTVTITGIADTTANRTRTFINVGTGVAVFKSEATESSAPYRLALPTNWNLSANATCTLWYDALSARHRGLSRT